MRRAEHCPRTTGGHHWPSNGSIAGTARSCRPTRRPTCPMPTVSASPLRHPRNWWSRRQVCRSTTTPYQQDFTAGVAGLDAPLVKVDGWSDWTVTPSWEDGTRSTTATIGHGLPMTSFKVSGGGGAQLTLAATPRVWQNDGATVGFAVNGHDYVGYAPTGARWRCPASGSRRTWPGRTTTRWRCCPP